MSHLKRLFALSGNECAEPNCIRTVIGKDGVTVIGKICHIEAASSDGPRWNSLMTDDERRDFDNLILLCDEDHSIIDNKENEAKFPVSLLQRWKKDHESRMLGEKLKNKPSLLKDAINAISSIGWDDVKEEESLKAFNLKEKITHNSLKRKVSLINEYKSYHSKINKLYDEIERQGSFKKEKLLANIRLIYTQVKGTYVLDSDNPIDEIRKNSDDIIDDVYEAIYAKIDESVFYDEDIVLAINLIIVDAFMRCKILEEPDNDSE